MDWPMRGLAAMQMGGPAPSAARRPRMPGTGLAALALVAAVALGTGRAQGQASVDPQREQREQIDRWQRAAQQTRDGLPEAAAPTWLPPLAAEQPCAVIDAVRIELDDTSAASAPPVPTALLQPADDFLHRCLGAVSLQRLQANLQARLQALGWITSTISLPAQDLAGGTLRLVLHWGRLGSVRMEREAGRDAPAAPLPATSALAVQPGQPLNLRDIEHSLETLARLPSQAARFVIEPGAQPGTSDLRLLVAVQPRWRMSLGVDTLQRQRGGSTTDLQAQLGLDAPLGLSDQLLVNAAGTPFGLDAAGSRHLSVYAQWSLPWQRHLFTLSASSARSARRILGGVGSFSERSIDDQAGLRWQWTPWRTAEGRSRIWLAWTERRARSRIDAVELLSRRRTASSATLGLGHWQRLGCGESSLEAEATHTLRMARVQGFQDTAAPLPRQWRLQVDWQCTLPSPWAGADEDAAGQRWTWSLSAWTQATERPFDGTDLQQLGGRWTVRGHGADQALQGRRISVLRTQLALPGQTQGDTPQRSLAWQPWLALDAGHIDRGAPAAGSSSPQRRLLAAVLGLRWQIGPVGAPLSWARALGPGASASPGANRGDWQAQADWSF